MGEADEAGTRSGAEDGAAAADGVADGVAAGADGGAAAGGAGADGGAAAGADGTTAVLYGMFASFTEALDRFDGRLAAIEEALRAGPGETAERLRSIEASLADRLGAVDRGMATLQGAVDEGVGVVGRRTAAVEEAVDEVRRLLQEHAEVTSHSLGRRAGEAGRRLAADLGLRPRPRSVGGPPGPGTPGG